MPGCRSWCIRGGDGGEVRRPAAVDLVVGTVEDLTRGTKHDADSFPPVMQELIDRGGLMPYVKARLAAQGGRPV
jgi:hypothetical protein